VSETAARLHLLTRVDDLALAAMEADKRAGHTVVCLCLHDAVYWASARLNGARPVPPGIDTLVAGADDCRRRSLSVPDGAALGYPAIVDAIAAASRAVCW
jgi:hypothetical protein